MCPVSSIFVDVNYGRCSVLLWRRCGTVCSLLPVPWMTSRLHTVARNIGDAKRAYILKSDCIRDSTALTPWRNRRIVKLTHQGQHRSDRGRSLISTIA